MLSICICAEPFTGAQALSRAKSWLSLLQKPTLVANSSLAKAGTSWAPQHPHWDLVWADLVHSLCMKSQLPTVHECNIPAMLVKHGLETVITTFNYDPRALRTGCVTLISHLKLTTLQCPILCKLFSWEYILITISCKRNISNECWELH